MGNYGMKVSKSGYNVLTADDKNLVFSSGLNVFQVYLIGTVNVTSAQTVEINHNLGYIPSFLAFVTFVGGTEDGLTSPIPSDYPIYPLIDLIHSTSSKLVIVVEFNDWGWSADSLDLKYAIFTNEIG